MTRLTLTSRLTQSGAGISIDLELSLQMARTGKRKQPGDDSQEEGGPEYVEISDTTAGGSTAPEDNPQEDYIERMGVLSKLWADNVRSNQGGAYEELLDQLLVLAHEVYPLLADAKAEEVLGCIKDTSGQYLIGNKGFVLQVEKDDCIIRRTNWKKVGKATDREDVKKALDTYYEIAEGLAKAQDTAMEAIEALGENLVDHDTIVNILKHIQNPCIQVTATQEKLAYQPCFPRDEDAVVAFDNYVGAMEDLAAKHSVYMEELWQVMQVATTHNATLTVMNNVFIPPIQVTVTSRSHTEATEGKPIQELVTARHLPDPQALPPSCTESTRVLAALLSFVLQREVSGQQATAAECATAFKCDADIMRQVTTGKKTKGKGGKGTKRKTSAASGSRTSPRKKARIAEQKEEDDDEDND